MEARGLYRHSRRLDLLPTRINREWSPGALRALGNMYTHRGLSAAAKQMAPRSQRVVGVSARRGGVQDLFHTGRAHQTRKP